MITATFDRIGRNHDVPPLNIDSDDPDDIAEKVYDYARPKLASRDVEVYVDLDKMTGGILCGFNSGGTFTLEREAECTPGCLKGPGHDGGCIDEQEIAEGKLRARDYAAWAAL